jgi:hypothetical protein
LHALAATEKGKHGKSVAAYAKRVGRPEDTVRHEVQAAEVAQVRPQGRISDLLDRAKHLTMIHAGPEQCWKALVERLIRDEWAKSTLECQHQQKGANIIGRRKARS